MEAQLIHLMKQVGVILILPVLLACVAAPADADQIYSNGAINGGKK